MGSFKIESLCILGPRVVKCYWEHKGRHLYFRVTPPANHLICRAAAPLRQNHKMVIVPPNGRPERSK